SRRGALLQPLQATMLWLWPGMARRCVCVRASAAICQVPVLEMREILPVSIVLFKRSSDVAAHACATPTHTWAPAEHACSLFIVILSFDFIVTLSFDTMTDGHPCDSGDAYHCATDEGQQVQDLWRQSCAGDVFSIYICV